MGAACNSAGYQRGLTPIWVSFGGGNRGFASKKEGKKGFRGDFLTVWGVCVKCCRYETETCEAEESVSDVWKHEWE